MQHMFLYLIEDNWRGLTKYIHQEDYPHKILAFKTVEDAEDHLEWETEHWDAEKKDREWHRFTIVEIQVPFVPN